MKKFKDLKVGDFLYSIFIKNKIYLTKEKILKIIPNVYYPDTWYDIITSGPESGCLLKKSEFNLSYLPQKDPGNGTYCADLDAVRKVFQSWIITMDDLENEIKKLK